MKYRLTHSEGSSRLLLIFAGWGMDDIVFSHLRRPGYDVMVVWDYRSFHIDWDCVSRYSEICLFAWSMGVYAASQTVQAIDGKITLRIAVNGTTTPVDDRFGIPEAIFYGTLDNLSEVTLNKFFRRMSATRDDNDLFNSRRPNRTIDELRDELQAVADRTILDTPSSMRWDLAVIGSNDRIFPRFNQLRAWQRTATPVSQLEAGHFFNFAKLIDKFLIDKSSAKHHFAGSGATYVRNAVVQVDAVERLVRIIKANKLLPAVINSKNAVLEIGSGAGTLSRQMAAMIRDAEIRLWDLASPIPDALPAGRRYSFRNCDAEIELAKVAPASLDHIFSASTIQWFNSPEKFFINCHRALRRDGYLFLTTYTAGNLHEISDITGNVLPLMTPDQWLSLAEKYFEVVAAESYTRDLDFDTPLDALRHLKLTGVNSLGRSSAGIVDAREIMRRYPMRLDGRYHLTYKPFIFILHKK